MSRIKIGIVAPSSRIEPAVADNVQALATALFPAEPPVLAFHPQCFLSSGHFAGDDKARLSAFLDVANDGGTDAVWFARGGYGACRIAADAMNALTDKARDKLYIGYSDAGFLLAALKRTGCRRLAHGPMPADIKRDGGERAVTRALRYIVEADRMALEPTIKENTPAAAFNLTILSALMATPFEPDLTGHVLMVEEVAEPLYRIDRALFHVLSNPRMRMIAGLRLGRCDPVTPNEPPFEKSEEEIARHWCAVAGVRYLGRADIGHDSDNKIVPLGLSPAA